MKTIKKLSFSPQEYQRRVRAVQSLMGSKELDTLVVSDLSNICYLCGFQTIGSYGYGLYALLVPRRGKPTLFASDFESHNARIVGSVEDLVVYGVSEQITGSPTERLADLMHERGMASGRIGGEWEWFGLTGSQMRVLTSRVSGAEWVEAGDTIERVKIIKSAEEIKILRRAAILTTAGTLAGIEAATAGARDNDIAAAVYQMVISEGGEYFGIQPIVTSGRRSGIPHSTFRRTLLKKGDTVFMEVSASYERYNSPNLRTICIGKPSAEARRALDACQASVRTVKENLRHGASAQQAARRAGKALRAIETRRVWHGYYGYSVGLAFPPLGNDCSRMGDITEATDYELRTGMVFHINTSLRKIGEFGVTMGDTVLITRNGCETLTTAPETIVREP